MAELVQPHQCLGDAGAIPISTGHGQGCVTADRALLSPAEAHFLPLESKAGAAATGRCAEIPQPHRLSQHLICQYEQDHPAEFINPEQLAQCQLREKSGL